MIKLIVGVGNPGIEYSKTRHNIGFISINKLVEFFNIKKFSNRYNSIYYEINNLKESRVFFLMPQTYMNNSGIAVLDPWCNVRTVHEQLEQVVNTAPK